MNFIIIKTRKVEIKILTLSLEHVYRNGFVYIVYDKLDLVFQILFKNVFRTDPHKKGVDGYRHDRQQDDREHVFDINGYARGLFQFRSVFSLRLETNSADNKKMSDV